MPATNQHVNLAARSNRRPASAADVLLRLLAAVALAVDGYVHTHDASFYAAPRGGILTQAALFRTETAAAVVAALLLLLGTRLPAVRRVSWLLGLLVAASALGGVLLYRFVDVGTLGPLPNMYEPTWDAPGKVLSAYAEGAATILTALGYLRAGWRFRPATPPTNADTNTQR